VKHLHRLISDGASTSKRLIWPGEQSVCAAVDTVHAKEFFTWNSTRSSTHGEKTRFRPVMSAWQMWKNLEKCRPIIKRMKPSNEPSLVDFSKPPPFISLARILKLQSFRNSQKKIKKKKTGLKKKHLSPFPTANWPKKNAKNPPVDHRRHLPQVLAAIKGKGLTDARSLVQGLDFVRSSVGL